MRYNETLTAKVRSLEESVSNTEVDQKASRETIMRLVAEVSRDQKELDTRAKNIEQLNQVGFNYHYTGSFATTDFQINASLD